MEVLSLSFSCSKRLIRQNPQSDVKGSESPPNLRAFCFNYLITSIHWKQQVSETHGNSAAKHHMKSLLHPNYFYLFDYLSISNHLLHLFSSFCGGLVVFTVYRVWYVKFSHLARQFEDRESHGSTWSEGCY